jgi:CheY-like chemotaxis protein
MKRERTVLLVDDDENDLIFLQRSFQQAQIHVPVQTVRDGQQAIDYLSGTGPFANRSQYEMPRLMILDQQMPRKTGLEVLHWLKEQPELVRLPVIMFSSSAYPPEVKEAYQYGANAFVTKPSSTAQRMEFVQIVKVFWLTLNEPPYLSLV